MGVKFVCTVYSASGPMHGVGRWITYIYIIIYIYIYIYVYFQKFIIRNLIICTRNNTCQSNKMKQAL